MSEISKLNLFAVKGSPMMVEWKEKELERRLGLYQVFLKLYEHHSSLLDEILELEDLYQQEARGQGAGSKGECQESPSLGAKRKTCGLSPHPYPIGLGATNQMGSNPHLYLSPCSLAPCSPAWFQPSLTKVKPLYIQGVVDTSVVYVVTNLCESTQSLRQPQQIWTIGRDRACGIQIADRYLSRHHAAIQYVEQQGFYLIDFNSTNGSYVNSELVYQPVLLKDGDRISLGNMTFYFFINHSHRVLPTVAVELLMQLVPTNASDKIQILTSPLEIQKHLAAKLDNVKISKDTNLIEKLQHQIHNLSAEQQSDILDRFFNRQTSDK